MTATAKRTETFPQLSLEARFMPESVNEEKRTIDICFTTGHKDERYNWWTGKRYLEELVVSEEAIRMDRLNRGAPILDTHDRWSVRSVLAVVVRAWIENGMGYATLRFSERDDVEPIWQDVRSGIICNWSVGYVVHEWEKVRGKPPEDDPEGEPGLDTYRAIDWEPHEISAVPIPFDPGAQSRTRAAGGEEPPGYQARVIEPIENRSTASDPTSNEAQRSDPMTTSAEGKQGASAEDLQRAKDEAAREAAIEERKRAAGIRSLVTQARLKDAEKVVSDLVESGKPLDECRAAILEKWSAEQDPAAVDNTAARGVDLGNDEVDTRRAGMSEALLHRFDPKRFKIDERGAKFRHLSLVEMCRGCVRRDGFDADGMATNEVIKRAMHSTDDFANILANTGNKSLRNGYEEAPRKFSPFVREVEVPDFKTVSRTQLSGVPALTKVNEHGEFEYAALSDGKETYQLQTYGKIIAITRQAIINDDLGAFTRIPMAFGKAAARKESSLVFGIFNANAAMADGTALFHADHSNLDSGAAISVTSVGTMRALIANQLGLSGDSEELLDLMPKFLICNTALEGTARQYASAEIAPTQGSEVNPWAGTFEVIATGFITSTSNWFMAASPDEVDIIELAYLQGQRGVYLETKSGWETDGMEWKARIDVEAAVLDYRGLAKNPN